VKDALICGLNEEFTTEFKLTFDDILDCNMVRVAQQFTISVSVSFCGGDADRQHSQRVLVDAYLTMLKAEDSKNLDIEWVTSGQCSNGQIRSTFRITHTFIGICPYDIDVTDPMVPVSPVGPPEDITTIIQDHPMIVPIFNIGQRYITYLAFSLFIFMLMFIR